PGHMLASTVDPPQNTTLFPYTTLFRSRNGDVFEPDFVDLLAAVQCGDRANSNTRRLHDDEQHRDAFLRACSVRIGAHEAEDPIGDRKSTRLNSSHGSISYGVFCLEE